MKTMEYNYRNTIKLTLAALAVSIPLHSRAAIVINEIDYDQPGSDTAEFIELFNNGNSTVSLDTFTISLINGSGSVEYLSIPLSGFSLNANAYFVVCNDTSLVANCDYDFTNNTGWIQNGAPDAVALFDDFNIVDSIAYEGELIPYTEGTPLILADSNTETMSLSRLPNGTDFDNNGLDFGQGCITPGSANLSGSGDCSSPNVVPLPAAAWLFGSGLVGLLAVTRRNKQA